MVRYILDDVDMILLMSVNPGYGGQSFIPAVMRKVADLRAMIDASGREIDIEVDGGVDMQNCTIGSRRPVRPSLSRGSAVFCRKIRRWRYVRCRGSEMKALLVASGIAPDAPFFCAQPVKRI